MSYSKKHGEKITFENDGQEISELFPVGEVKDLSGNKLSEPLIFMDSLKDVTDFLDGNELGYSVPRITIIPNVLKDFGNIANERKRMNYNHKEFDKKANLLQDKIDKEYQIASKKLQTEKEVELEKIYSTEKQNVLNMELRSAFAMKKMIGQYKIKNKEIDLRYQNIERERKKDERRSDEIIKIVKKVQKNEDEIIQDAKEVSAPLKEKMINSTATVEERNAYIELLKLRTSKTYSIRELILQLEEIKDRRDEDV